MKRTLTLFLALLMILSLCACGGGEETEKELSEDEWAAVWATFYVRDYLLDVLKKPSSLEINSIRGSDLQEDDCYYFEIDYTAENGFGGAARDQLYIAIEEGASAEGGSCISIGSSTFDGAENQTYTKRSYDEITSKKRSYNVDTILSEVEKYISE